MGQNQDKLEDDEHMPGEELVGRGNEFREGGHHTRDTMEGGSSSDEEAANTEEESGETEALDFGPGQESSTSDSENSINLWENPSTYEEMRAGVANAERGGRRILHVHETNQNPKSRMNRTSTHLHQIKKTKKGQPAANTVMEQQTEGRVPNEEDFSRAGASCGLIPVDVDSEEDSGVMKMKRRGPSAAIGNLSLSHHPDQMHNLEVEVREADNIKSSGGTVCHFRGRKEPAPAKPQHPLKNRAQKGPLSDMSLTIHSNHPKEGTASNTKGKTVLFDEGNDLGEEINYSFKKNIGNGCHTGSLKSHLGTVPAKQESLCLEKTDEPGSILEKLLKRNKIEASSSLSKIKEVTIDNSHALDNIGYSPAAHHFSDKPSKTNDSTKQHLNINQMHRGEYNSPGGHYGQAVNQNTPDSLKSHNDFTIRLNTMPTCALNNSETILKSHEKKGRSESVIKDDVLQSRSPTVGAGLLTVKEATLVKRVKVQSYQSQKAKDDSVIVREKPQSALKPRPVSELIKESIQIHEKLVQQERSSPAELKASEHGPSVKVAQMKAAFDSAQKSPERTIERKPSMRKGRSMKPDRNDLL